MKQCHDEVPTAEPELPFILDADIRFGIEDRIHAASADFNLREWMAPPFSRPQHRRRCFCRLMARLNGVVVPRNHPRRRAHGRRERAAVL
jgi:hypothetical protein